MSQRPATHRIITVIVGLATLGAVATFISLRDTPSAISPQDQRESPDATGLPYRTYGNALFSIQYPADWHVGEFDNLVVISKDTPNADIGGPNSSGPRFAVQTRPLEADDAQLTLEQWLRKHSSQTDREGQPWQTTMDRFGGATWTRREGVNPVFAGRAVTFYALADKTVVSLTYALTGESRAAAEVLESMARSVVMSPSAGTQ